MRTFFYVFVITFAGSLMALSSELSIKKEVIPARAINVSGEFVPVNGVRYSIESADDFGISLVFSPLHAQVDGNYFYDYLAQDDLMVVVRDKGLPAVYIYILDEATKRRPEEISLEHPPPYPKCVVHFDFRTNPPDDYSSIRALRIGDFVVIYIRKDLGDYLEGDGETAKRNIGDNPIMLISLATQSVVFGTYKSRRPTGFNDPLMPSRIFAPYCPERVCRLLSDQGEPASYDDLIDNTIIPMRKVVVGDDIFDNRFLYGFASRYQNRLDMKNIHQDFVDKLVFLEAARKEGITASEELVMSEVRHRLESMAGRDREKINEIFQDLTERGIMEYFDEVSKSIHIQRLFAISKWIELKHYELGIAGVPAGKDISMARDGMPHYNYVVISAKDNENTEKLLDLRRELIDIGKIVIPSNGFHVNVGMPALGKYLTGREREIINFWRGSIKAEKVVEVAKLRDRSALVIPYKIAYWDFESEREENSRKIREEIDRVVAALAPGMGIRIVDDAIPESELQRRQREIAEFKRASIERTEILKRLEEPLFSEGELAELWVEPDYGKMADPLGRARAYDFHGRYAEALKTLESAAESDARAKVELGLYLRAGRPGIPADEDGGVRLLRAALAELPREGGDDPESHLWRGRAMLELSGLEPDVPRRRDMAERAASELAKAAAGGRAEAWYYRNHHYRTRPQELDAYQIARAAESGHPDAAAFMAWLALNRPKWFPGSVDGASHLAAIKESIRRGSLFGQYALGAIYLEPPTFGDYPPIAKNPARAVFWLRRAAERGDPDARNAIGQPLFKDAERALKRAAANDGN